MVSPRHRSVRSALGAFAAIAAAAIVTGCGASQSQLNPQGSNQFSSAVATRSTVEPQACRYQGGVRATPCRVQLSASNPGPVTVTLRTPHGSKGSIVEHDSCGGASGVATITGSGDTWQVTAGSTAGACKARFNYFNNSQKDGWVRITIQSSV
jgi:hypothetical protein